MFVNWNTQQNGGGQTVTAQTIITTNMTVYAQWTAEPVNGVCGVAHQVPTVNAPN